MLSSNMLLLNHILLIDVTFSTPTRFIASKGAKRLDFKGISVVKAYLLKPILVNR
jgi:hypothetical protein